MEFKILFSDNKYKGKILAVDQIEARMPNGKTGKFDLVRHNDSVSILPLDDDGNIWFVNQYRLGANQILLELPAGVMEPGENPLDCAHREIREETGMDAGAWILLGKAFLAPGYCTEAMYFYLARKLHPSPLGHDEDEFIEIQKIPAGSIDTVIEEGLIQDSKTLAAIALARRYL